MSQLHCNKQVPLSNWHTRFSKLYIYCNEDEIITHAFLFCQYIKRFWKEVKHFARDLQYDYMHIEDIGKVMGLDQHDKENKPVYIVILIVKENNWIIFEKNLIDQRNSKEI